MLFSSPLNILFQTLTVCPNVVFLCICVCFLWSFVVQGYVVEATAPIPNLTLICEYVGEVDYTRHHLFDGEDDIMDLIRSPRSATRFVIAI